MRALIAEDDPIARRVLSTLLRRWGFDVVVCADGTEAWGVLSGPDAPRLAVLDWEMPGVDGVEVCRRVRATGVEPYTYVLLVTGREGRESMLDGLDAGADDYVTKPFDAAELEARLRAGRRIVTLQEQLMRAGEVLRHQATHDGLTGVLNRVGIFDVMKREANEMRRRGGGLAALVVDVDHFKRVNDVWGHGVGDLVLAETAARIGAALRSGDRIGRMGGEEFLLLLPGCDDDGAREVAERVRASVACAPVATADGLVPVTCSVGVARTADASRLDDLVPRADAALYRAKRLGRNRVEEEPEGACET